MGLQKNLEIDDSGVVLSYWHLSHIVQKIDSKQIDVTFHAYVSESAYKSKKQPAGPALRYTLTVQDLPPGTDIRVLTGELLYRAVKAKSGAAAALPRDGNLSRLPEIYGFPTDPFFADAADVGVG